jgi:Transglycosylase SLT domain/SPOR domain
MLWYSAVPDMSGVIRAALFFFRHAAGTALALTIAMSLRTQSRAEDRPSRSAMCLMMESAATANDLPVEFLTRVIWRESRFDPQAIGPRTRRGMRAEGIAQFMPGTAAERDLDDPFDPVEALPKAAAFLRELRSEFGNLGLAAAAYNAGPQRVRDWMAGARTLPAETRRYVQAITGHDADEWAKAGADKVTNAPADCATLMASLQQPPSNFAYELERRVTAAMSKIWSVELAAGFSRDRVLSAYARLMTTLSGVIGSHDPVITSAVLRSRGTRPLYQARIGADTRTSANTICARIRQAGAACIVTRVEAKAARADAPVAWEP